MLTDFKFNAKHDHYQKNRNELFFGHLLRERELEEPPIYSFLRLVAGFCHAKIDNSIPPTGIVCVSAIVTHSFIPPDIYLKGDLILIIILPFLPKC